MGSGYLLLTNGHVRARKAATPAIDQARSVVREKPWSMAALVGVVGMAIIGSLRGRAKA